LKVVHGSLPQGVAAPADADGRGRRRSHGLRTPVFRTLRQIEPAIIPAWFGTEITGPVFHRGFIEQVTAPISFLLEPRGRERLFTFHPIRHLNITGIQTREEFTLLLALPELKDLISLGLDAQNLDDDSNLHLIRSAGKNLTWKSHKWDNPGSLPFA
jgi:hypothetical protein